MTEIIAPPTLAAVPPERRPTRRVRMPMAIVTIDKIPQRVILIVAPRNPKLQLL